MLNSPGTSRIACFEPMLLQRVACGANGLTARATLALATRGGARVLNRDDIGHLAAGMAADFVTFRIDGLRHAGALHDPVAALVLAAPANVAFSVINGRMVVRDGEIVTIDLPRVVESHNRLARALVATADS